MELRRRRWRVDAGRVIVEGFIDFDYEITLLTVRSLNENGDVITSFCEPIGHVQVQGDYVESWQPHPMHPTALDKARDISRKVTENLGGLGLFGVELFVKGEMVWFSEVSPRPHDTGMVTMVTQVQSEFELHAKAILGLPVMSRCASPGASAVIYGQHDAKGIAFEVSPMPCAFPAPTSVCSASRNRSVVAAWGWHWPPPMISILPASAPSKPQPRSSRSSPAKQQNRFTAANAGVRSR